MTGPESDLNWYRIVPNQIFENADTKFSQHDHIAIPLIWEVPKMGSFGLLVLSMLVAILELLKYIFFHAGLLAISFLPESLFVRVSSLNEKTLDLVGRNHSDVTEAIHQTSSTEIAQLIPDMEIKALASSLVEKGTEYIKRFPTLGIVSLYAALLQPKSRGSVHLATSNPFDQPRIDLGYFSDPADYPTARKPIRLAFKCADVMKIQGFPIMRAHHLPEDLEDDQNADEYARQQLRTVYHYTSTCRMAPVDDVRAKGVVDNELRVYRVENLRVADASVFPNVLATHM